MSTTTIKDCDASDRAGAEFGYKLLDELIALQGRPDAEEKAFRAVHNKLHALSQQEHFDSAASGFAIAIANALALGAAHMPEIGKVQ